MTAAGIVLAGGKSRRMGGDKAELVLHGETLLGRMVRVLSTVVNEVLVVGREGPEGCEPGPDPPVRYVADRIEGMGPLAGIVTGLEFTSQDMALVVACDMPFVAPDVSRLLVRRQEASDGQATVPVIDGVPQPLHAVYSRQALPSLRRVLAATDAAARAPMIALSRLRVTWVRERELRPLDPDLRSFVNVNSREQWERLTSRHV